MRASEDGRVLFSADEDEITIGAEKLKVTGTVMKVFELFFNLIKAHTIAEKILSETVEVFSEN